MRQMQGSHHGLQGCIALGLIPRLAKLGKLLSASVVLRGCGHFMYFSWWPESTPRGWHGRWRIGLVVRG